MKAVMAALGRQADQQGRGAADRGEYCQVA